MNRSNSALFLGCAVSLMTLAPRDVAAQSRAAEVHRLAEHPALERAFEIIEELEPRTVQDHIELTQVAAPPFAEQARAAVYASWLRAAGADSVWIDEEGDVIGLRRGHGVDGGSTPDGGRRTVAISGHLDTVFPADVDVTVTQRGDTLFAPGIGDDTRGLIAVLTVLRSLEEAGVETRADVRFIATVGEEGLGDLRGMKALFREGADPIHAWIDLDGTGLPYIEPNAFWQVVLGDLHQETPVPVMAARFHKSLAKIIANMVTRLVSDQEKSGRVIRTIALSGGCFQNKILLEGLIMRLEGSGLNIITHAHVPANDGGLSLGQAAVAAARQISR